jgi:hypothetical protein
MNDDDRPLVIAILIFIFLLLASLAVKSDTDQSGGGSFDPTVPIPPAHAVFFSISMQARQFGSTAPPWQLFAWR